MSLAKIDLAALNDLLDNQKKLDDIFDSAFDEDPLLSTPDPLSELTLATSHQENNGDYYSDEFWSADSNKNNIIQTKRSVAYLILPVVLEIAALYYGIIYFIL